MEQPYMSTTAAASFVKEITLIKFEKPLKMKSLTNQTTKFSLFMATIKLHETNSNVFSKS